MQIQVVRHEGRAQNPQRDQKALRIAQRAAGLGDAMRHFLPGRIGLEQQEHKRQRDHGQQQGDHAFMPVGIAARHGQHGKGANPRHRDARDERQSEQQPQRNRAADQFGQRGRQDGGLAGQPGCLGQTRGKVAGGEGGQIVTGGKRQARHQHLKTQRQKGRRNDDHQQAVAKPAAAGDVGRPVARIDVADGDQDARPDHAAQVRGNPRVLRQGGIAA